MGSRVICGRWGLFVMCCRWIFNFIGGVVWCGMNYDWWCVCVFVYGLILDT